MAARSSSSQAVTADDGFGSGAFQNLDSAGSAGPAASAGSGQASAKDAHEPGTVEARAAREFGVPVVLLRVPCSCGWRGAWYADPEYVARSFARHAGPRS
jgi:hypothetical protein